MRSSLGEAGGGLDAEHGAVGELVEGARRRRRSQAERTPEQISSIRSSTPGRAGSRNIRGAGDALLEERLAGAVEGAVAARCGR